MEFVTTGNNNVWLYELILFIVFFRDDAFDRCDLNGNAKTEWETVVEVLYKWWQQLSLSTELLQRQNMYWLHDCTYTFVIQSDKGCRNIQTMCSGNTYVPLFLHVRHVAVIES